MPDAFSSAECGLLLEIERSPQDDAPRLVYADWLSENGEPEMAELIVVQCALASRDALDGERRRALEARQAATVRDAERRWIARLGLPAESCTLERGLPDRLVMGGRDFVACDFRVPADVLLPELVLRFHEAETELQITRQVRQVFDSPNVERVRRLDLSGVRYSRAKLVPCGDLIADLLCDAQRLAGLRGLAMRASSLTNGGAEALAAADSLSGLALLDLEANELTAHGARALAASRALVGLQELRLGLNFIEEASFEGLQKRLGPRLKLGAQHQPYRYPRRS